MENIVRNNDCQDQSERITCKNATCKAEIEKSESEAKRYNGWGGHRQIEKATFYRFCRIFVAFSGTDKNYKNQLEKRQSVAFLSLFCSFFAFF